MAQAFAQYKSPVGVLKVWADDVGLTSLEWRLRVLNDLNDEPPVPSAALDIANAAVVTQDVQFRACDFTGAPNGQTRTGEGVTPNKAFGEAQFTAQCANLILEQFS